MSELKRLPNWEERFYNRLEDHRDTPFAWGTHDCATCAADLIERITGVDLMADLRGLYDSLETSLNVVQKSGHDSFEEIVSSKLPAIDDLYKAHRGDLILCEVKGKRFLAIKTGTVAVAPGKTGLMHINMTHWVSAWKV